MKTREMCVNMSHEHIVQALTQYLANSVLRPWEDYEVVLDADLGLTLNDEGYVPILFTLEELEDGDE